MKVESPLLEDVKVLRHREGSAKHTLGVTDKSDAAKRESPETFNLSAPLQLRIPYSVASYSNNCGTAFCTNGSHSPRTWPSPPMDSGSISGSACYSTSTSAPNNALVYCNLNTPISPGTCSSAGSSFGVPTKKEDTSLYTTMPDYYTAGPDIQSTYGSQLTSGMSNILSSMSKPSHAMAHTQDLDTKVSDIDMGEQNMCLANMQKVDEPYAKLIYRAFMSKPDRTMTLQELYQWFRENTNKAVNETTGWQNSIRHNLSMNAAFAKPKPIVTQGSTATEENLAESKRSTKWVLAEWAAKEGVQSTTRYRKHNSGRRNTNRRHPGHQHPPLHGGQARVMGMPLLSPRAQSGRKGGCAARNFRQHRLNFAARAVLHDEVGSSTGHYRSQQRHLYGASFHGDNNSASTTNSTGNNNGTSIAAMEHYVRGGVSQDTLFVNPMYYVAQQQHQFPYGVASLPYSAYQQQHGVGGGEYVTEGGFTPASESLW